MEKGRCIIYQQITIVGNLGGDPDMRYTPSGQAVTNFSVATNRKWTGSDGEKREETTWFRVSTWGKLAEVCNQYLGKGKKALISGRLNPDENGSPKIWTRKDGTAAASFEITADRVIFLSPKGDDIAPESHLADVGAQTDIEDVPF